MRAGGKIGEKFLLAKVSGCIVSYHTKIVMCFASFYTCFSQPTHLAHAFLSSCYHDTGVTTAYGLVPHGNCPQSRSTDHVDGSGGNFLWYSSLHGCLPGWVLSTAYSRESGNIEPEKQVCLPKRFTRRSLLLF